MAVMAKTRSHLTHILLVVIATALGCHGSPVLCRLGVNPSDAELQRYQLCIQAQIASTGLRMADISRPSIEEELEDLSRSIEGPQGHPAEVIAELDDAEIHTFPACIDLSYDKCRELLTLLEDITEKLEGTDDMVVRRRRGKRSLYYPLLHLLRYMKRSGGNDDTRKLLMMYQQWRSENGYGQARGRWGRSMDQLARSRENSRRKVRLQKRSFGRFDSSSDEGATKSVVSKLPRTRRSLDGGEYGDDVYSILEQYRQWREEHGYGKFTGRWGR